MATFIAVLSYTQSGAGLKENTEGYGRNISKNLKIRGIALQLIEFYRFFLSLIGEGKLKMARLLIEIIYIQYHFDCTIV